MLRTVTSKVVLGAVVAIAATLVDTPNASAFGWRHGSAGSYGSWGSSGGSSGGWASSGGSHGSWGSSGGSSGGWGSSGGSHGSWGSSGGSHGAYGASHGRRLLSRLFHRNAGYFHSSGGSHGSWGSSGGSHGSWGSSGGSSGGTVVPAESDAPAPPASESTSSDRKLLNAVVLDVSLPADARVYINDRLTRSTGSDRRYVSDGLDMGSVYTYELRAEVIRSGRRLVKKEVVKLKAGDEVDVKFSFGQEIDEQNAALPLDTKLIVRVPEDAKVILAGTDAPSTGTVRTFTTRELSEGQRWDDYTVRVEVARDGRVETKEEVISLAAGETREIDFDFADNKVAAR